MPQIKAYRYRNQLVPVTHAKIKTAYACPFTGDYFKTKTAYTQHLQIHRRKIHSAIRWANINKRKEVVWRQNSFEKVIQSLADNSDLMMEIALRSNPNCNPSRFDTPEDFKFEITRLELTYSDNTSNSHNAPHNGVTNWCRRDEGLPTGYAGWSGTIWYEGSSEIPGFSSSSINSMRVLTGTGGGGFNGGRYEVIFFLDDWEGLKKMTAMMLLRGDRLTYNYNKEAV